MSDSAPTRQGVSPTSREAKEVAAQIARDKVAEVMAAGPARARFLLERGRNRTNKENSIYVRNGFVYDVETYAFFDSKREPWRLRVVAEVSGQETAGDGIDDLIDVGEPGPAPTRADLKAATRYEATDSWVAGEGFRTEGIIPSVSLERTQALVDATSAAFTADPDGLACYVHINGLTLPQLEELVSEHPVEFVRKYSRDRIPKRAWWWTPKWRLTPPFFALLRALPGADLAALFASMERIYGGVPEYEYGLFQCREEAAFLRVVALEFEAMVGWHTFFLSRAAAGCRTHFACYTCNSPYTGGEFLECLSHGPDAPPELLAVVHPVPSKRSVMYDMDESENFE